MILPNPRNQLLHGFKYTPNQPCLPHKGWVLVSMHVLFR